MDKIVVITGGNSGIGKCTADIFRNKGDKVISVSMAIDENYPEFSYVCDITDEKRVIEVVDDIREKYGRIDVLINNAGMGVNGALEMLPSDTVKKVMDVNVFGAYLMSKYSLPLMKKGSKIIYISSVSGVMGAPFRSLYCFTKSAVLMMALCQRMELKQAGIDVVAICPGEVKTPFMKNRIRITDTNERYGKQVDRAFEFLDKHDEGKRMAPEKVGKIIVKQCYKKRTKPMLVIGGPFKLMHFGTRVLPISWTLGITNKFMGGGTID